MKTFRCKLLGLMLVLASTGLSCVHAPPAIGSRVVGAGPDADQPEMNCDVNNTVDCRPGSY